MNHDFVCYSGCLYTFKGSVEMSEAKMFCINMSVNNCSVSVSFDWTGQDEDSGPCWDTMEVVALLSSPVSPEAKHWVIVNDLLSDDDWVAIEMEIYAQWKELERQAYEQDY